ncbi:MAG: type VII secretion integral membrane protein EccD [Nakamurella sp.]
MTSPASADYRRVTVIAPGRRFDLAVPGDLAITDLLPEVLDLARIDRFDRTPGWQLGRVGGPGFAVDRSLDDLGIRDGDLLLLRPVDLPDPLPVVDEITDVTAAVAAEQGVVRPDVGPQLTLATVAGVLAAAAPAAWQQRATAGVALTMVVLILWAATVAARARRSPPAALVLGGAALGYATIAAVGMAAPELRAEPLVAAIVMLIGTVLLAAFLGSGRRIFGALATVAGFGVLAGAMHLVIDVGTVGVAVGALVTSTSVLPWAPRLAARLGRLPHPGSGPVDHDSTLPRLDLFELRRAAQTSVDLLGAMDLGLAVVTGVSAVVLVETGERWSSVLACLGLLVVLLRARTVRIAFQAMGLAVPAVAALIVGLILVASRLPPGAGPWIPMGATVVAGLVLACGLLGPRRRWSPTARRLARVCETVIMLAVVPVAVGAVQGYQLVRQG